MITVVPRRPELRRRTKKEIVWKEIDGAWRAVHKKRWSRRQIVTVRRQAGESCLKTEFSRSEFRYTCMMFINPAILVYIID